MTEPSWVQHAVWWHVYPLGFLGADTTGADNTPARTLQDLEGWLEYAIELGASGLALGPIFASSTHGYDTVDYEQVDPRLGDMADFDHLVAAAHDRGLKVLLDGVFNHVGRDFPRFRRALEDGPGSAEAHWFHLTWPVGSDDASSGPSYDSFEGHPSLVTLNHQSPDVADFVTQVMTHWLDRGADGWRLDAAYAVPPDFWAAVLPRVRASSPDAYVVGEVIHGDYGDMVTRTGLDAVTQYELWKATWSSINDLNLFELAWALGRHNEHLETFVPMTFVGNHDVTRIASQIHDERHIAHALVLLMTLAGTPSIYYGDEQGLRGVKEERAGGDDAIRPVFPSNPDALPEDGWPTYRLHQQLIGLRRRHAWLHRARTRVVELKNQQLTYEMAAGEDRLLVTLNLSDDEIPSGIGAPLMCSDEGGLDTVVPPHGWSIGLS